MSAAAASSTCAAICLPFSTTFSAGADDRVAADDHRFRPAGAAAGDQLVAVALHQPDAPERDAEPCRQHLRERRPVPLAVIQGAGDDRHVAVGLEADAAHLAPRRPGQFEIVADAAPAQFAARPALRLPRREPVPIGQRQRLVQQIGEIAAVIGRAVRRLVRHRPRAGCGCCRRSSTRSIPISRAAVSTSRSM